MIKTSGVGKVEHGKNTLRAGGSVNQRLKGINDCLLHSY